MHFLAFAGFYYHYQIWDRVWGREERKGDHLQMILLPWILILAVAGPYCAVYVAVLITGYAFCMAVTWKREKRLEKRYLLYGLSVLRHFSVICGAMPRWCRTERLWGGPRVAVPEPVPDFRVILSGLC